MRKLWVFFALTFMGMWILIGCNAGEEADTMEDFTVIYNTQQLEQEVVDWLNTAKTNTGIYKKEFPSGNYVLINLGEHKQHLIKKIHVNKDNYGYIFNITLKEAENDRPLQGEALVWPILLQTDLASENTKCDVKIIYP